MEDRSNVYIVAIVGIVAVVALVMMIFGGHRATVVSPDEYAGQAYARTTLNEGTDCSAYKDMNTCNAQPDCYWITNKGSGVSFCGKWPI